MLLLEPGDQDHDPDSGQQGGQLGQGLSQAGRRVQEVRNDGDGGHVDEPSGREGKDPGGDVGCPSCQEGEEGARDGSHSRQQLQAHGLPPGTAGLDQDGKVADFVGHLVEEDRSRRHDPDRGSRQVGCSDREAVRKVVSKIGRKVQVPRDTDLLLIMMIMMLMMWLII